MCCPLKRQEQEAQEANVSPHALVHLRATRQLMRLVINIHPRPRGHADGYGTNGSRDLDDIMSHVRVYTFAEAGRTTYSTEKNEQVIPPWRLDDDESCVEPK